MVAETPFAGFLGTRHLSPGPGALTPCVSDQTPESKPESRLSELSKQLSPSTDGELHADLIALPHRIR
jgi:hypothetical protein